jgi:hypothetical protein
MIRVSIDGIEPFSEGELLREMNNETVDLIIELEQSIENISKAEAIERVFEGMRE